MKYIVILVVGFLFSCSNHHNSSEEFIEGNEVSTKQNVLSDYQASIEIDSSNFSRLSFIEKTKEQFKKKSTKILHQCEGFCQPNEAKLSYFTHKFNIFLDSTVLFDRRMKFSGGEGTKFYVRTWLFNDRQNLNYINSELLKPFDGVEFTFKSPHIIHQEGDSLHIFYVYTKGDESKLYSKYKKIENPG